MHFAIALSYPSFLELGLPQKLVCFIKGIVLQEMAELNLGLLNCFLNRAIVMLTAPKNFNQIYDSSQSWAIIVLNSGSSTSFCKAF